MATNQRFKERFIGKGAMGNVYELEGHKPPAVIKYMFRGNGEKLKLFKNECEALKAVYHANVVRMLYTEENGSQLGMVMEYCQRGSLRDVIFNPTISYSMNTVLTWGVQLFDAIDHMYQKHKLVHRDIKPDNIFVTNEYQLKIGDFGLVKVVGDGTVTRTFIGTPRYLSPPDMKQDGVQRDVYEQIKGADVSNSHRDDVYSLGLVMWEIIERRTIFTNYEIFGMFDRARLLFDIAIKRITEIEWPECQSEVQEIILRCTNFQRIHRPTASQVLDFLKQTQKIDSKTRTAVLRSLNVKQSKKIPEDDPQNPSAPIDYSSSSLDPSPETSTSSKEEKPEMVKVIKTGNSLKEMTQFNERKEIFSRAYPELSIEQKRKFKEKSDRDLKNIKQPTVYSDGLYESLQENEKPESVEEIFDDMKNLHLRAQLDEFFDAFLLIERVKRTHFEFSLLYQQLAECLERLRPFKDSIYTRRIQFNCYYSTLDKESWLLLKQIDVNTCYLTRFIKKDLSTVKYLFGERIDGFSEDAPPKLINKRFLEHEVKTIRETLQDNKPNLVSVFEKELDEQELMQTEILEKFSDYEELILKNRETVDLLQVIRAVEEAQRAIDSRFDTQSKSNRKVEEPLFSNLDFFRLRNPQSPSHQCLSREHCKKIDFPKDLHLCPSKAKLFYYECTPAQQVSLMKRRFTFSQLFNELSGFKSPLKELKVKVESMQVSDLHQKESLLFLTYPLAKASEKEFVVLLDDPFAYAPGERISCFDRRLKFYTIDAKICQDFYKEFSLKFMLEKFMLGIDMNLNAWRINH